MYKKILVPTDGSECADKEIEVASKLIDTDGEIIVVSVSKFILGGLFQAQQEVDEINKVFSEASKFHVELMEKKFNPNINVKTRIIEENTSPADGICEVADEEDVDLIVISSTGETGLLGIGSVAEKVSRITKKNVFLIH